MLDTDFLNPFIKGAAEALKVQGGLAVIGEAPFVKGKKPMNAISVAGQIGLTSSTFKGVICLCFEGAPFLKMVSYMFGEDVKEINGENQDAAAELLNIVYGAAKTAWNVKGYKFEMAIPTVVRGKDLQVSQGNMPVLVVPLKSEFGYIYIEIAIKD